MKTLFVALMAFYSVSALAHEVYPNQMCKGVNESNQVIETTLYVGKKIDKTYSSARLIISLEGKVFEVEGSITTKRDLAGVRMFKNSEDTLRYTTSGILIDLDSYELRSNLKCTVFRTVFL